MAEQASDAVLEVAHMSEIAMAAEEERSGGNGRSGGSVVLK